MAERVGRGLCGSLRAQVRAELRDLYRHNKTLRRVRSGPIHRALVDLIGGVRLIELIPLYLLLLAFSGLAEWWLTAHAPRFLPDWGKFDLAPFIKDIASYFMAGQVGILGIVSVAVGVVTLLMQRDDQASGTADVRLYYSQSFAYEVVTSGVALLIVLCVQMFWPVQFALHLFQGGGANLTFELGLTVIHAFWMSVNLLLFYQFIVTTLRFVEPDARKRMRDRYTADVAMPRDLARRLIQALYINAPRSLFGEDGLKEGPQVQFGMGGYFLAQPTTEVEFRFDRPSRLFDVRMRPLAYVIGRWRARVQAREPVQNRSFSGHKWDGELNISHSFESLLDGPTAWLLREGEVTLQPWERLLVRLSFYFSRAEREPRDPVTPSDFMSDLTDRVAGQIDRTAMSGFKTALSELVSYHSFVLATQDTATPTGEPVNFAQIGGVFSFDRPDQSWVHLYRPIYFAAANKIEIQPEIMDRLGYVARSLVPADARNVSATVVTNLLEVGYYEVVALEAWFTRRTGVEHEGSEDAQPRFVLAGSDRRAYERVLINFVGAWETTLQTGPIAYKWHESDAGADEVQWAARARAWPYIQTHLHTCAYFFALAVWNEDQMGAGRYRDMLLRWLNPFHDELRNGYAYQHPEFLSPDLFGLSWDRASQIAQSFQRGAFSSRAFPKTLTGLALRSTHDDVLIVSAAIVLSWNVQGRQPAEIGREQALAVLQRNLLDGEGSTILLAGVPQASPFEASIAVLIKTALGSPPDRVSYPAALAGLVNQLGTMSEGRAVPGRVYSGWGANGVDTLRPYLLAIMAAYYPENGAAITAWSDWFVANEQIFWDGDRSLRGVIYDVQRLADIVQPGGAVDEFDRALAALKPGADVAERRGKVRSFLTDLADRLIKGREGRLRAAPVDPAKLSQVRDALRRELLAHGPEIVVFHGFTVRSGFTVAAEARTLRYGVDKAELVTPSMSDRSVDELATMTVRVERQHLAEEVWRSFWARPRRTMTLDMDQDAASRWRTLISQKAAVGASPILLVPWEPLGEELSHWTFQLDRPSEFTIEKIDGTPSGGGASYIGTIDGVHVYPINGLDHAMLCSAEALRNVTYDLLPDHHDIIDVSFAEASVLAESRLEIRTAQVLDWSDAPIIEFGWGASPTA